jgi:hypothetical protein
MKFSSQKSRFILFIIPLYMISCSPEFKMDQSISHGLQDYQLFYSESYDILGDLIKAEKKIVNRKEGLDYLYSELNIRGYNKEVQVLENMRNSFNERDIHMYSGRTQTILPDTLDYSRFDITFEGREFLIEMMHNSINMTPMEFIQYMEPRIVELIDSEIPESDLIVANNAIMLYETTKFFVDNESEIFGVEEGRIENLCPWLIAGTTLSGGLLGASVGCLAGTAFTSYTGPLGWGAGCFTGALAGATGLGGILFGGAFFAVTVAYCLDNPNPPVDPGIPANPYIFHGITASDLIVNLNFGPGIQLVPIIPNCC